MPEGVIEFTIPRPPAEVWAVVADMEQAPRWVPDLVSVKKETPGEVGVGTRYSEVVKMGGNEGDATLEVTRFEPPRVYAHEGQGGPARFSAIFTLEPVAGGTKVTHAYAVHMSGFMKMMEPMMAGWVRKNSEASIELLQALFAEDA